MSVKNKCVICDAVFESKSNQLLCSLCSMMFSDLLDMEKYFMLNLVTFSILFTVSAICFFISCLFNDYKRAISIGAAIPILFIVIKMIAAIDEKLSFLKYFTLFSLVDTAEILSNNTYNVMVIIGSLIGGIAVYAASIIMFDKRSLSI